jgi:hypothetical protein
MGIAFPNIPVNQLIDLDPTPREELSNWIKYAKGEKYWQDKLNRAMALFNVTSGDALIELLENKFSAIQYNKKELKKDLNEMKNCWAIVRQ